VSSTNRGHERDTHVGRTLLQIRGESESVALTIDPITVCEGEVGLSSTRKQIIGPEVLDTLLLRMLALILRVRTGDENLSVAEEYSFRMVHAGDGGVGKDGHALTERLLGVVHDRVEVRIVSETETTTTDLCAAEDEVATVREGDHVGHDTLGGL
jgi:hypothetical protein